MIALVTASSADTKIATSQGLPPGTYRGPAYVTRFDGEGRWATSSDPQTPTQGQGRYTVDDNIVAFTTTPPACPQERVRYRLLAEPKGFRLHFLDDSCGRAAQIADIVFVRQR